MGLFSKGFINKLWSDTKDAAISTATTKVKTSFMDMLKTSVRNANSFNLFSNLWGSFDAYQDFYVGANNSFTSNYSANILNGKNAQMSSDLDPQSGVNKGIFNSNHLKVVDMPRAYSYENSKFDTELNGIKWKASIPDYGYDQFINERTIFQKGLHNFFGEPSYFYFKIFFIFAVIALIIRNHNIIRTDIFDYFRKTADVVLVKVGDDHQVDALDALLLKAGGKLLARLVRARIDEDARPTGRYNERRIRLAHIVKDNTKPLRRKSNSGEIRLDRGKIAG